MKFHRALQFVGGIMFAVALYFFGIRMDMKLDTPSTTMFLNLVYIIGSIVIGIFFIAIGEIGAYLYDIRETMTRDDEDKEED